MDTNEEWSVPNSDDERDEELLGLTQNGCHHDVPVKILKYYEDIEKNKVLELNVKEFRKPFKQDIVDDDKHSCQKELQEERKDDEESSTCADEEKDTHLEKSNEPSEFDYLEEPDEGQGQLTRRTPKTGRLPKKRVGTLKNVISNLKRYKQLDSSTSEDPKITTAENKSDFESNKDVSELQDDPDDSKKT